VRLLLDEHLSPAIAQQLRRLGHDVVAGAERSELRGLYDADLLAVGADERRVLVTQDVADLMPLGARRLDATRSHHGIVLVSRASFPLSRAGIGRMVLALDQFLSTHRSDDALVGEVVWLPRGPSDT
jgi:hypothetical protein